MVTPVAEMVALVTKRPGGIQTVFFCDFAAAVQLLIAVLQSTGVAGSGPLKVGVATAP